MIRNANSDNRGFTLIELLTTVTIIGILSAIASHQFLAYTQRAFDARAERDIRDAATAEEAFYAENEAYASCSNAGCNTVLPGFHLSLDVQLTLTARDDDQAFDASVEHPAGSKIFHYSSNLGSLTWDWKP